MKKVLVAVAATASIPMLLSPIEAEASTGSAEPGNQPAITAGAEPSESADDLGAGGTESKAEDDFVIKAESEPAEPDSQFVAVTETTIGPESMDQFTITDEIELNSQPDIVTPEIFDTGEVTESPEPDDQFITTQFVVSETKSDTESAAESDTEPVIESDADLQIGSEAESVDSLDQFFLTEEVNSTETIRSNSQPAAAEADLTESDTETTESAMLDDNLVTANEPAPEDQPATVAESVYPTSKEAYEIMVGLKDKYPEGMEWTNYTPYGTSGTEGSSYVWKGGTIDNVNSGVGCAAFAMILSDTVFDNLPARKVTSFTFADVKVGDILRVNGNSHSVIVLQKSDAGVIIAEANYNKSVHWGRVMTVEEVEAANYILTRYPEGFDPSDDAENDSKIDSGTEGNLSWTLTSGGTLTISGNGAMPDFSINDNILPTWNTYKDQINTVIIAQGVTSIGDYAFYGSQILNVYIGEDVTSIGQSAFRGSSLMSVTIPGKVTTIGDDAFRGCANLVSASISEGVKTIGERAFENCTSLTHIDFPSTITSIGAGAFTACKEMTRVRFAPGSEVVEIGDNLFTACWKLTDVTLPEKADCISAGMFASCQLLTKLYIPAGVTEIKGLDTPGGSPFSSCPLSVIDFGGSEEAWNNIGGKFALTYAGLTNTTTVNFNVAFDNPFAEDTATAPDNGDSEDKDSADNNQDNEDNNDNEDDTSDNENQGSSNPDSSGGQGSSNPSGSGSNGSSNPGGSGSNGSNSQGSGNQGSNGSQSGNSQNDHTGGTDADHAGTSSDQLSAPDTSVVTTVPLQNASDNAITAATVGESIEAAELKNEPDSLKDSSNTAATKRENNTTAKAVNDQETADDNSDQASGAIISQEIAERLSELEQENGHLHKTVRNLIIGMSALGTGALGELLFILRKLRIIRKKPLK